ncbi:MAG TPA: chorismate mutase [Steroidobacteraceae bacterium]|jgi:3-deoxy-7-phosphoheptulonate synthase/chorismate mutase|nr:chorismate mutase [Steroidobacteraceae bacterium]
MRAARKSVRASAPNAAPPLPADVPARMAELRQSLDQINRQLLALLEERGRLVHEVMRIKREHSLPVHDPERERRMLDALLSASSGVYPRASLEHVFASIFEVSRALGRDTDRK